MSRSTLVFWVLSGALCCAVAATAGADPKVRGHISDLDAPVADILRRLPGVVDVEILVAPKDPTHRLIHVRDYHYVPRSLFALDMRQALGKDLTEKELDDLYREHLCDVELVQLEQEGLLRCLVRGHGLRRVLVEGLTPRGVEGYRLALSILKDVNPPLRELTLKYGASGRLAMTGEVEALPLDDDVNLEAAKPVRPDGTVRVDPKRLRVRHDGQVRAALKAGPVSVLVLGGSHDLSRSVRRIGQGTTEYIRVTTKKCRDLLR